MTRRPYVVDWGPGDGAKTPGRLLDRIIKMNGE